ncbi:phosphatidylserine/phosphatidylglycerophosphate/cardiolipin synthase family protein [Geomicrobium sp. JCM 19038]|uniref:phospholipase D-like domain-containing protein n=1 Tax=Geomicrobium sp. JCM 19038 TaxID=1460635 RepID=UPI00045F23F1|nr:phospholipase D-like domain-containing protein [Geomicrobium sp. JCM 19038]GAK06999.1 cardiolipin synthetase [Geomicrobium sp. JCM 19038]
MALTIFFSIFFLFILFVILVVLDFRGGRSKHQAQATDAVITSKRNGKAELIDDGQVFFNTLFRDIETAHDHVHLSFFIWKEGRIGEQLLALCERKARDGVQVLILVDRLGSAITKQVKTRVEQSGVVFAYTHSPKFPHWFYNANRRYHRKIAVIDQRTAYIGGFNVGDEYIGKNPKYGFWRDLHIRIEGTILDDIQQRFLDDWEGARAPKPNLTTTPSDKVGKEVFQLFYSEGKGVIDKLNEWFNRAEHSITIVTPYFIPSKVLHHTLMSKARKGISVKILIPDIEDHPFVKSAAYAYLPSLMEAGCKFYRYTDGFYHGKAIVIDGKEAQIGSANFDKRSFHLNDELDLVVPGGSFVQTIAKTLRKDIAGAVPLTLEDVKNRSVLNKIKTKIAVMISEFL